MPWGSRRELFFYWYLTAFQACGVSRICQLRVRPWAGFGGSSAMTLAATGLFRSQQWDEGVGEAYWTGPSRLQPAFLLLDP